MTEKVEAVKSAWKRRLALAGAAIGTAGLTLVSSASALQIDWGDLTGLLRNVSTTIFPEISTMVIAIVPVILILAIVAFITGFFGKILDMIKGVL